ncbi:MAG TPA: hypothetical protein VGD08_03990 [Stellaceae bacterium]|jgi:hypothetical protein
MSDAAGEASNKEQRLHVTTLLVASPRALNNALDDLGFVEDDNRVVDHEGRLAFVVCSHDQDCDDLFALVAELASRGESWELLSRIDVGEARVIFQSLARHRPVEAIETDWVSDMDEPEQDLQAFDLDGETGVAGLRRALRRLDPANLFVTVSASATGRATARIVQRNPRRAVAAATAVDEGSLRTAIREILPSVMFGVAMRPPG